MLHAHAHFLFVGSVPVPSARTHTRHTMMLMTEFLHMCFLFLGVSFCVCSFIICLVYSFRYTAAVCPEVLGLFFPSLFDPLARTGWCTTLNAYVVFLYLFFVSLKHTTNAAAAAAFPFCFIWQHRTAKQPQTKRICACASRWWWAVRWIFAQSRQ